jgi:ribosome biogenesis GTPase / thiamine phosphate phosphatase
MISSANVDLSALGWSDFFGRHFTPHAAAGLVPARVAQEHKHAYVLLAESGEFRGELRGRLLKDGLHAGLPVVGDWVAAEIQPGQHRASIHAVLPRRTQFSRRAAGDRTQEQVVAANIDTVFLVSGLDADFNPRRIERYLALARTSGAQTVVVLNKSDVCPDAEARAAQIRSLSSDVPVLALSAETGCGVEGLTPFLGAERTVALLGSSGAGKSTLANRLFGSLRQAVGALREHDQRGRHTTARRELFVLPDGTLLIDTPGMRELQLWENASEGLAAVFPEMMSLGAGCRFRDCRHESEPGCAVQAALARGEMEAGRFASFLKLRAELESLPKERSRNTAQPGAPRVTGRRIMRS